MHSTQSRTMKIQKNYKRPVKKRATLLFFIGSLSFASVLLGGIGQAIATPLLLTPDSSIKESRYFKIEDPQEYISTLETTDELYEQLQLALQSHQEPSDSLQRLYTYLALGKLSLILGYPDDALVFYGSGLHEFENLSRELIEQPQYVHENTLAMSVLETSYTKKSSDTIQKLHDVGYMYLSQSEYVLAHETYQQIFDFVNQSSIPRFHHSSSTESQLESSKLEVLSSQFLSPNPIDDADSSSLDDVAIDQPSEIQISQSQFLSSDSSKVLDSQQDA